MLNKHVEVKATYSLNDLSLKRIKLLAILEFALIHRFDTSLSYLYIVKLVSKSNSIARHWEKHQYQVQPPSQESCDPA